MVFCHLAVACAGRTSKGKAEQVAPPLNVIRSVYNSVSLDVRRRLKGNSILFIVRFPHGSP